LSIKARRIQVNSGWSCNSKNPGFSRGNLSPWITIHWWPSQPPTLEKLCDTLNIPYFVNKERFWEKQHHHLFGSMGTRKQVEASNSNIRKHEDYPLEYKNIIPEIAAKISKDSVFQKNPDGSARP